MDGGMCMSTGKGMSAGLKGLDRHAQIPIGLLPALPALPPSTLIPRGTQLIRIDWNKPCTCLARDDMVRTSVDQ